MYCPHCQEYIEHLKFEKRGYASVSEYGICDTSGCDFQYDDTEYGDHDIEETCYFCPECEVELRIEDLLEDDPNYEEDEDDDEYRSDDEDDEDDEDEPRSQNGFPARQEIQNIIDGDTQIAGANSLTNFNSMIHSRPSLIRERTIKCEKCQENNVYQAGEESITCKNLKCNHEIIINK